MYFLIAYDRERGTLVQITQFEESEFEKASNARLKLEQDQVRLGSVREIVLLEAATDDALRRTHRRYFAGVAELANRSEFAFSNPTTD